MNIEQKFGKAKMLIGALMILALVVVGNSAFVSAQFAQADDTATTTVDAPADTTVDAPADTSTDDATSTDTTSGGTSATSSDQTSGDTDVTATSSDATSTDEIATPATIVEETTYQLTIDAGVTGTLVHVTGTASSTGEDLEGTAVSEYHITLTWGDGSESTEASSTFDTSGGLTGTYEGNHVYTESGTYTVTADLYYNEVEETVDSTPAVRPFVANSPIASASTNVTITTSNTECSDGIDNEPYPYDFNGDGVVNALDFNYIPSHFGEMVTPGSTGDLNDDGVINDADFDLFAPHFGETAHQGDGFIDANDSDCHSDGDASNINSYNPDGLSEESYQVATVTPPTTPPTPPTSHNGGHSSYNPPSGGQVLGASIGAGEVLGTSTGCYPDYIGSFIKAGSKNTLEDVVRLQLFLNAQLGLHNPVNGVYDAATEAAVEKYQLLHSTDILSPWMPFGLGKDMATGYVYKTTQWFINNQMCPSSEIPFPKLP